MTQSAKATPLARRPTFLVYQLNAEMARICNPVFRQLGVDLITSRILVLLLERSQVYVGDIVEIMALPQSTVSHQLKRLAKAELIVRQADKRDSRTMLIKLSTKGRRLAERCNGISAGILDALFDDFSDADLGQLVSHLERMSTKMKNISTSELRQAVL